MLAQNIILMGYNICITVNGLHSFKITNNIVTYITSVCQHIAPLVTRKRGLTGHAYTACIYRVAWYIDLLAMRGTTLSGVITQCKSASPIVTAAMICVIIAPIAFRLFNQLRYFVLNMVVLIVMGWPKRPRGFCQWLQKNISFKKLRCL